MFQFIKNSIAWISIPLLAVFIFSTIKELATETNGLLFQSLISLVTWVVFALLAVVVGISNSLCFKGLPKQIEEGTTQQILQQQEALYYNRISALRKGGIISFIFFVILGLMTTPVLPVFPIEANWYFIIMLLVCWVFVMVGYNKLLKKLSAN